MEQLQQIPGVTLVQPKGAFYCLPVMASFFGPSASADGFGAIPDADTLCRWASFLYLAVSHQSLWQAKTSLQCRNAFLLSPDVSELRFLV